MNFLYRECRNQAYRSGFIDGSSYNFSPTPTHKQEIRKYFGERLDQIVDNGLNFMKRQLIEGPKEETEVLYRLMETFLSSPDIARWAVLQGHPRYFDGHVLFPPLAAFIKDIGKEKGILKQKGPKLVLAEGP